MTPLFVSPVISTSAEDRNVTNGGAAGGRTHHEAREKGNKLFDQQSTVQAIDVSRTFSKASSLVLGLIEAVSPLNERGPPFITFSPTGKSRIDNC